MIDFSLPPELEDLRDRTLAFVREVVIAHEPFVDEPAKFNAAMAES